MDETLVHRRRWAILGVLVLCLLVVILDNTILNVALKTIQEDLGASQSEMQWAIDSYALVFAGLLITGGVLGDRLGRKRVLIFGMVAFGATSALCSFASSPTQLIFFRALMGIGAAAVQPQTLSIIQNVFEPSERPKAIGIWAGAAGMAIAIGPIAGGALIKYFWWGSIFLVNVPFVIVGVVAIFFLVPDSKNPRPGRLDPAGVVLSIVALVVLVYGVIQGGNSNEWLRWNSLGAILLGCALLAAFVYVQAHSPNPTIDVDLFRNRHFTAGVVAIAVTFFVLMGSTFYLAYFMQAVRGYTALAAGGAAVGAVRPSVGDRGGAGRVRRSDALLRAGYADDAPVGHRGHHGGHRHRHGAGHDAGHQLDHERRPQREGRRGRRRQQHRAPGGCRTRRRCARVDPRCGVQQQREHAEQVIGGFIDDADDSFVTAMRVTSIVAGLVGLLGAVAAFVYLPTRREHA